MNRFLNRAPRVLVGGLHHETHTFLAGRTTAGDIEWQRAPEIWGQQGAATPLAGALSVARGCGWDVVPVLHANGVSGPCVEDSVVEAWWNEWERAIVQQSGPVDAIFLALHGAMVSGSLPDVEGELLTRLRELVGPDVFIGGVLDLHANYSPAMARAADVLVCYRENPHTDGWTSGARAAKLLARLLDDPSDHAHTLCAHAPLIWAPPDTGTAQGPMRALEAKARALEAGHPDFWAVNVFSGYSFADTPWTGVSFSVVTSGDDDEARAALQELCDQAMQGAQDMEGDELSLGAALYDVSALLRDSARRGPIVLAEPSDNIGAGAPGDGTHLLRALLAHNFGRPHSARFDGAQTPLIGAILCDAHAVEQAQSWQPGEARRVCVGGQVSPLSGPPLALMATRLHMSNGEFALQDRDSHMAAAGVRLVEMGPSVLLRVEPQPRSGIHNRALLLLTSRPTPPWDLGQWRSMGVDPRALDIFVAKAAVAHRRTYDPIAFASLLVRTPGPCTSDLSALPYTHVRRPIWPLDPLDAFGAERLLEATATS